MNSGITGALEVVTRRSSIGRELGTTTSCSSPIVAPEVARDWLLRQLNPEATDAALCRSLISTLGVTAMPKTEHRFPADGAAYRVTIGCSFDIHDEAQIPAALDKIEQAMTPATPEQCEGWLVMLQAATAHRAGSGATSAVAYSLFAAELRQWPADVAKFACERIARGRPGQTGANWFPTLAELVAECERLASNRRAILSALQRYVPPPAPHVNDMRFSDGPGAHDRATVRRMAEEACAKLRAAPDKRAARVPTAPNTAGKPDAGGLTPAMREFIARRAGERGE
jgi:hypothetical protein